MPAPVTLRAATPKGVIETTSALASALRRRRAELEFSRVSAAMQMSVHERTVRAWESGRVPEINQWPRIIAFLGFEPWPEPTTPVQKLRAARRRRGLSITDAALILNVDPSTLWWWEHGRRPRGREHRARVATFAGDIRAEGAPPPSAHRTEPPAPVPGPLGDLIRDRRKEVGVSQRDAARAIGVNTWTLLLWEQGRYAPTPRFYPALILFLGREPWPEPRTLGEQLQAERLRHGFTRKQLAAVLDVDLGSLAKWEGGQAPRHGQVIAKLEAFVSGMPQPRRTARRRCAVKNSQRGA